ITEGNSYGHSSCCAGRGRHQPDIPRELVVLQGTGKSGESAEEVLGVSALGHLGKHPTLLLGPVGEGAVEGSVLVPLRPTDLPQGWIPIFSAPTSSCDVGYTVLIDVHITGLGLGLVFSLLKFLL